MCEDATYASPSPYLRPPASRAADPRTSLDAYSNERGVPGDTDDISLLLERDACERYDDDAERASGEPRRGICMPRGSSSRPHADTEGSAGGSYLPHQDTPHQSPSHAERCVRMRSRV